MKIISHFARDHADYCEHYSKYDFLNFDASKSGRELIKSWDSLQIATCTWLETENCTYTCHSHGFKKQYISKACGTIGYRAFDRSPLTMNMVAYSTKESILVRFRKRK